MSGHDDGERATAEVIAPGGPDWIEATGSPAELAAVAGAWIDTVTSPVRGS